MGRGGIAELLLSRGARLDLFAAAMLGETEVVRAVLTGHPEMRDAKGPHTIPLRAHAEAGGEQARAVLELLDADRLSELGGGGGSFVERRPLDLAHLEHLEHVAFLHVVEA